MQLEPSKANYSITVFVEISQVCKCNPISLADCRLRLGFPIAIEINEGGGLDLKLFLIYYKFQLSNLLISRNISRCAVAIEGLDKYSKLLIN